MKITIDGLKFKLKIVNKSKSFVSVLLKNLNPKNTYKRNFNLFDDSLLDVLNKYKDRQIAIISIPKTINSCYIYDFSICDWELIAKYTDINLNNIYDDGSFVYIKNGRGIYLIYNKNKKVDDIIINYKNIDTIEFGPYLFYNNLFIKNIEIVRVL